MTAAAGHKLVMLLDERNGEPHFREGNQLEGWLRQVEVLRTAA